MTFYFSLDPSEMFDEADKRVPSQEHAAPVSEVLFWGR